MTTQKLQVSVKKIGMMMKTADQVTPKNDDQDDDEDVHY